MSYEYVTIGELEHELCVRLLLDWISSLTFSRMNVFSSLYIFCQCIFKYCIYSFSKELRGSMNSVPMPVVWHFLSRVLISSSSNHFRITRFGIEQASIKSFNFSFKDRNYPMPCLIQINPIFQSLGSNSFRTLSSHPTNTPHPRRQPRRCFLARTYWTESLSLSAPISSKRSSRTDSGCSTKTSDAAGTCTHSSLSPAN